MITDVKQHWAGWQTSVKVLPENYPTSAMGKWLLLPTPHGAVVSNTSLIRTPWRTYASKKRCQWKKMASRKSYTHHPGWACPRGKRRRTPSNKMAVHILELRLKKELNCTWRNYWWGGIHVYVVLGILLYEPNKYHTYFMKSFSFTATTEHYKWSRRNLIEENIKKRKYIPLTYAYSYEFPTIFLWL